VLSPLIVSPASASDYPAKTRSANGGVGRGTADLNRPPWWREPISRPQRMKGSLPTDMMPGAVHGPGLAKGYQ